MQSTALPGGENEIEDEDDDEILDSGRSSRTGPAETRTVIKMLDYREEEVLGGGPAIKLSSDRLPSFGRMQGCFQLSSRRSKETIQSARFIDEEKSS